MIQGVFFGLSVLCWIKHEPVCNNNGLLKHSNIVLFRRLAVLVHSNSSCLLTDSDPSQDRTTVRCKKSKNRRNYLGWITGSWFMYYIAYIFS
jgi:hypothetical protein